MPFIVYVWGPGASAETPQRKKREVLRRDLEELVGAGRVFFSEDPALAAARTGGAFHAEYIDVRSADVIVALPESFGSLAELALYLDNIQVKTIVFVTDYGEEGFARHVYTLLNTKEVEPEEWDSCTRIRRLTREYVEQMRVRKHRGLDRRFDWE